MQTNEIKMRPIGMPYQTSVHALRTTRHSSSRMAPTQVTENVVPLLSTAPTLKATGNLPPMTGLI